MESLLNIAVGILLPIIPAYILYKTLPARTKVSGPFKGLNIQLGGAFGGYFLLVLVIFAYFATQQKPPPPMAPYEIWKVKGLVKVDQTESASPLVKDVHLSIEPDLKRILEDGTFWLDILVKLNRTDDELTREFPTLLIGHPLYQTVTIDLNEKEYPYGSPYNKEKEYEIKQKEIIIKKPIILQKR